MVPVFVKANVLICVVNGCFGGSLFLYADGTQTKANVLAFTIVMYESAFWHNDCSNSYVINERDAVTEEGGAGEAAGAKGTLPISCFKQPFFSKSASSRQYR